MSGEMQSITRLLVESDSDIVSVRQAGRSMAAEIGFTGSDLTVIATAISEIARNIVVYARRGEMTISPVILRSKRGIEIVARDEGPGIPDVTLAMQDGYSTGKSLGLGLPGSKRLMDEFEIRSEVGAGTTIIMTKWMR